MNAEQIKAAYTPTPATLVLFGMLHTEANPNRSQSIADIDPLIKMAADFDYKNRKAVWERRQTDYIDSAAIFYNVHKPHQWDCVQMAEM